MADQQENPTPAAPPADLIEAASEEKCAVVDESGKDAADKSAKKENEEVRPMIDVHAPHESVHTWKDVLIHIGIITVGLLLAVGLEQLVEYFHHRQQVAETREALTSERRVNIFNFASQTKELQRVIPILRTNLSIFQYLRKHPGAPKSQWPGELQWYALYVGYTESAWQIAQTSGVTNYMPPKETRRLGFLYNRLKILSEENQTSRMQKNRIFINSIEEQDPAMLSPAQLDEQIRVTAELIHDYSICASEQASIHVNFPEFQPAPTFDEVFAIGNVAVLPEERRVVDDAIKQLGATRAFEESGLVEQQKISH